MELIDRFTYVIESVLILVILGIVYWRVPDPTMLLVDIFIAGLLLILWFVLRRTHAAVNPEKKVRKAVGGGRPVLLDFFSNFSSACLVNSIPIIMLQRRHKARVEVISIDMNNPAGRAVAALYGARVGSLVLLDHKGEELARGWWPGQKLMAAIMSPTTR